MSFTATYLEETLAIVRTISVPDTERVVSELSAIRERGGRLMILGVGGSAGHASHAVNDFRKICHIEAYAPSDNVSELTARVNDEGWDTTYSEWLKGSRLSSKDGILVFSVGGGDLEKGVSANLVRAVQLAKERGATVLAIVGRDGGFVAKEADAAVVIAPMYPERVTPHTEGLTAVVWHLFVSHPSLKAVSTHWESLSARP